jgi:nitrous oxidase accessory protein
VWRNPLAKLLLNSPSVQLLKWMQSEFPGLHPGGITDSKPLMLPAPVTLSDHSDSLAYVAEQGE